MGVVYEDLYDHEGYAQGRSSVARSNEPRDRTRVDAYEAACSCGWIGELDYPLTEQGRELAIGEWEHSHALPLLQLAVPASVAAVVEDAQRAVRELAGRRPKAARELLERHARWLASVENDILATEARRRLDETSLPAPRQVGRSP